MAEIIADTPEQVTIRFTDSATSPSKDANVTIGQHDQDLKVLLYRTAIGKVGYVTGIELLSDPPFNGRLTIKSYGEDMAYLEPYPLIIEGCKINLLRTQLCDMSVIFGH